MTREAAGSLYWPSHFPSPSEALRAISSLPPNSSRISLQKTLSRGSWGVTSCAFQSRRLKETHRGGSGKSGENGPQAQAAQRHGGATGPVQSLSALPIPFAPCGHPGATTSSSWFIPALPHCCEAVPILGELLALPH